MGLVSNPGVFVVGIVVERRPRPSANSPTDEKPRLPRSIDSRVLPLATLASSTSSMFSASSPPRRPRTRLLVSVVAANAASAFSSSAGTFRSFRTPPNRAGLRDFLRAVARPRSASCGIFTPPRL